MKLKVIEPTSLSEIPLQSYQKWIKVKEGTTDQELLAHKFVQIFLGLTLTDAVQIKANDIRKFMGSLAMVLKEKPVFKQEFTFNGIEFGFIPDLENISWGEYMDIEQNLTSWETYHIALAVMYRPITKRYKDTYEIMEYKGDTAFHDLFKIIGLDIALSASVFFYNLEKALLKDTLQYLGQETEQTSQILTSLVNGHSSTSSGGGTTAFIDSLKAMSSGSIKSSPYLFIRHLPSYPTKSRKTRSNTTSRKDKLIK